MSIKHLVFLLVFISSLTACVIIDRSTGVTQDVDVQPTMKPSTLPVLTQSLPVASTNSPFPTVTPDFVMMATPTSTVLSQCFTLLSELPANRSYSGKIIMFGEEVNENIESPYRPIYYLDLMNYLNIESRSDMLEKVEVSPDGTKFAALDVNDDVVKIFSQDGLLLKTVPEGEYLYTLDHWLNNKELALVILRPEEGTTNPLSYMYPFEQALFNVNTNELTFLSPDYPGIDRSDSRPYWDGISSTKYDPTLTRVVYPAVIEPNNSGGLLGYILYDLEKQEVLLKLVTGDFGATPKWTSDGSKFVVNDSDGNGEFFVITRDGNVRQVSQMNAGLTNKESIRYFSEVYNWSPDGQHIAFWREWFTEETLEMTLSILDTETGMVTDTCIHAGNLHKGLRDYLDDYVPIWSPDGNAIVAKVSMEDYYHFETILIDLQELTGVTIGEMVFPVGWLANTDE